MINFQFFLREPAWKIFWLGFLPVLAGSMLGASAQNIVVSQLSFLFGIFVELAWIYTVSNYLAHRYADRVDVPIQKLNAVLAIVAVYYLLAVPGMIPEQMGRPAFLLVVVLSFYYTYFLARLLVMAEKERNVTVKEYLPTAVMIFFWAIGIWFLQPRIRRIYSNLRLL